MELSLVSHLVVAGIVAKGLGVIAVIFGLGAVLGVVVTLMVMSKIRGFRDRH